MKFTYYGYACFAVEAAGRTLLFDPFITGNPLAKSIDIDKIAADYILLSHGHADHVADVEPIAQRTNAVVLGPFEVGNWFEKKGVKNIQALNPGGTGSFDFGKVKLTTRHPQQFHAGRFVRRERLRVRRAERLGLFLFRRRYRSDAGHEADRRGIHA